MVSQTRLRLHYTCRASTERVLLPLPPPAAAAPVKGPTEDMAGAITESRRRLATSAKPEAVNLPVPFPIGAVSSGPGSLDETR